MTHKTKKPGTKKPRTKNSETPTIPERVRPQKITNFYNNVLVAACCEGTARSLNFEKTPPASPRSYASSVEESRTQEPSSLGRV